MAAVILTLMGLNMTAGFGNISRNLGLITIRFENRQVFQNLGGVLERIGEKVTGAALEKPDT